jgi:two-component sensor histidine kinase
MTDDSIAADLRRRLSEAEADRDRYRAIFDSLDEGFCTIEVIEDAQGRPVDYRFLETNTAFVQQTGLTDAVGRRMKELAPGHEAHWFDIYGRIARSRVAERFEDRAEALGRWYDVFALPVDAPEQKRVAVIFHDILDRRRTEIALRESEQRSRALVSASSDVIYRMSPDWQEMRVMDGRGFLADINAPSVRWIDEFLIEEDRPHILAVIAAAIRDKSVFECEHRVRQADGSVGWTLSRAIPILDEAGEIVEWFGMAADITRRHQAVEHLRLVANELNHRVKNNLAMVQAIAMQTFRPGADHDQSLTRFSERLVALARANDLLTGERWAGVDLRGALEQAVSSHCDDPDHLRLDGPDVAISAKSALALTLAGHELATNATKYGAWSRPEGCVSIRWSLSDGRRLSIEWRERGGPPVTPPTTRGFGSRLIERGLAMELNGTATLAYEPEGLVCRIEAVLPEPDDMA